MTKVKKYRQQHVRAAFRSAAFMALLVGFAVCGYITDKLDDNNQNPLATNPLGTRLWEEVEVYADIDDDGKCADTFRKKADPAWLSVFYFLGVLYSFLAIAIVCDELFVPALEEMASCKCSAV
jgi:hypothetical protein